MTAPSNPTKRGHLLALLAVMACLCMTSAAAQHDSAQYSYNTEKGQESYTPQKHSNNNAHRNNQRHHGHVITNENIHHLVKEWARDPVAIQAQYGHISKWNTSLVTDFNYLFAPARLGEPGKNGLQEDISHWDTSNARSMHFMFAGDPAMNLNFTRWDVSKVQDFSGMFAGTKVFRGHGLGHWITSHARNMSGMFHHADAFNNDNIAHWNTTLVKDMSRMFGGAKSFVGRKPLKWDTRHCHDFSHMFGHSAFAGDVSHFNLRSARTLNGMFEMAFSFNGDVSKWMTGNVHDFNATFAEAVAFEGTGVEHWNMTAAVNTHMMFMRAEKFNADLSTWDMSHVKDARNMFRHATAFNQNVCWHLNEHAKVSGIFFHSQGHFSGECVDSSFISSSCCDTQLDPACGCTNDGHAEPHGHNHNNDQQNAAGTPPQEKSSQTNQSYASTQSANGSQFLLAVGLAAVVLAAAGALWFRKRQSKALELDRTMKAAVEPYSDSGSQDDEMEDVTDIEEASGTSGELA